MNSHLSNDPQHVWQNQDADQPSASPQQIQEKLRQFHRRRKIAGGVFLVLVVSIGTGLGIEALQTPSALRSIGFALQSAGWLIWSIAGILASRRSQPATLSPGAPLMTSVQFYRRALEGMLDRMRWNGRGLLAGLLPVALGILVVGFTPRDSSSKTAEDKLRQFILNLGIPDWLAAWLPFIVLIGAWLFLMVYGRALSTTALKNEIQWLDRIENQNRDRTAD